LRGEKARSHFGRALDELGIEWIAAHSPQAKGRIERLFETLQDRLVKEMRLAGIDSIATASHFLETRLLPQWEGRFSVAPRNPRNAHRWLHREQRLEEILSVRVGRQVPRITPSAGMATAGACHAKKCARVFGVRRWKSNDDWMARTCYASAAAISACAIAQHPCGSPQVLPAFGLQDLRNKYRDQKQNQTQILRACRSPLEKTLEADISIWRKTGHFYFALTRTEIPFPN
jgi:hypothetical protein